MLSKVLLHHHKVKSRNCCSRSRNYFGGVPLERRIKQNKSSLLIASPLVSLTFDAHLCKHRYTNDSKQTWSHTTNRPPLEDLLGIALATVITAGAVAICSTELELQPTRGLISFCEEDSANANAFEDVKYETGQSLTNWSSTHSCNPRRVYEPSSAQEVCRILEAHHQAKLKIRPVGTALSPNGLGMSSTITSSSSSSSSSNDSNQNSTVDMNINTVLSSSHSNSGDDGTSSNGNSNSSNSNSHGNLLSVCNIDYVEVNRERMLVTVGAGARVSDVLAELGKYNLTLENFSSIQEQQMGGWTQVAAHGTGCTLPTVDEMIVRMKIATPTQGLLTLSENLNPQLFRMAKVGLGALGVVTELTLRVVPKFKLREYMYMTDDKQGIAEQHTEKLAQYRHVRYMWLPYTGKVVVVVSNPVPDTGLLFGSSLTTLEKQITRKVQAEEQSLRAQREKQQGDLPPTKALYELLLSLQPPSTGLKAEDVQKLSFSQLRDALLDYAPLDVEHIKKVNQAEASFWSQSTGARVDDSTNILGFDCGGEQWVLEVCFPIGTLKENEKTPKDLQFVQKLLRLIETHQLPAPSPIEQRWTARSLAPMSPAYAPESCPDDLFSWVGIIMYLPPGQTPAERELITEKFRGYVQVIRPLMEEYGAQCHWAKIELPSGSAPGKRKEEGRKTVPASQDTCPAWFGTPEIKNDPLRYAAELDFMRKSLARKYPVKEFNQYRNALDPNHILSNELIDKLFNENDNISP